MQGVLVGILWLCVFAGCGLGFFLGRGRGSSSRSLLMTEMPPREESKGSLLREIKAKESSPARNAVWKRKQYPSAESLVKRYASQLERAQVEGEDGLKAVDFGDGAWDEIVGDWTLLYTNNVANSPTTSISLPPPPFSGEKEDINVFQLDSVIQRISRSSFGVGSDTYRHLQVDHILRFALALPKIPSSQEDGFIRERALQGEVVLEHDVKVVSDNAPAKLAIDLRDVKVRVEDDKGVMRDDSTDPLAEAFKTLLRSIAGLTGGSTDWTSSGNAAYLTMLSVPLTKVLGPAYLRRGWFEVTYVDEDIRISRGPFGELRVFRRMDDKEEPEQVQVQVQEVVSDKTVAVVEEVEEEPSPVEAKAQEEKDEEPVASESPSDSDESNGDDIVY